MRSTSAPRGVRPRGGVSNGHLAHEYDRCDTATVNERPRGGGPEHAYQRERCVECGRPPVEAAEFYSRWRYWLNDLDEPRAFCPGCALREFEYLIPE